jgi:hypothetical protein
MWAGLKERRGFGSCFKTTERERERERENLFLLSYAPSSNQILT